MGRIVDNRLSQVNVAINTVPYSQSSKDNLQNKINYDSANASDVYNVQEEQTFGKLDWQNLSVRITHVLSDKNTSDKKNDDWRQIIFGDISHIYGLGIRYQFDNCIWITVQSDIYHYPTASATVRRCNNVLKWYDSNNVLQTEPCIIDEKITYYRNDVTTNITIPQTTIKVICQYNNASKTIDQNRRFLFNGRSYKIEAIDNFLSKTTYGNDPQLLELYMFRDEVNSSADDVPNNIANGLNITNSSTPTTDNYILPNVTSILQNNTQTYTVNHYVSGTADSNTFTITASGALASLFTLTITDGNHFSVKSLGYTSTKLVVTCKNNVDATTVQISINLKGLV